MITLAVLLPSYIISEHIIGEGAGALVALVFGLTITNHGYIMKKLGRTSSVKIDKKKLRGFHEEVVLFIKSFFFVYIGVVVTLSWKYAFIGFTVVLVLMAMRYTVATALSGPLMLTRTERSISSVVFAAGLPSFVMSQLPMIYDPNGVYFPAPSIYPDLCMPIVLGTILYSALIGSWMIRNDLKIDEKQVE